MDECKSFLDELEVKGGTGNGLVDREDDVNAADERMGDPWCVTNTLLKPLRRLVTCKLIHEVPDDRNDQWTFLSTVVVDK